MAETGGHSLFLMDLMAAALRAAGGGERLTDETRRPAVVPNDPPETRSRLNGINADLEVCVRNICKALAPELVLEIGAHRATFSRVMRIRLPEARVVAFEGNRDTFDRHQAENLAAGVEYLHLCVADAPGTVQFHVPRAKESGKVKHAMGSLLKDKVLAGRAAMELEVREVPAVTLDGFLGEEADRTKVMWVDVEGAIGTVLGGAGRSLDSCLAFYAEVENVARWDGQMLDRELVELMGAHGLRPVLRDLQRTWQYNLLFLSDAALAVPGVRDLCEGYLDGVARKLSGRSEAGADNSEAGREDAEALLAARRAERQRRKQAVQDDPEAVAARREERRRRQREAQEAAGPVPDRRAERRGAERARRSAGAGAATAEIED